MKLTEVLKKGSKNPTDPLDPPKPQQPSQDEKALSYDEALQKWRRQIDEEERKKDLTKSVLINWNRSKKTTKK